VGGIQTLTP